MVVLGRKSPETTLTFPPVQFRIPGKISQAHMGADTARCGYRMPRNGRASQVSFGRILVTRRRMAFYSAHGTAFPNRKSGYHAAVGHSGPAANSTRSAGNARCAAFNAAARPSNSALTAT